MEDIRMNSICTARNIKDKIIIVDCDGVLLDWEHAFDTWMHRHNYKMADPNNYDICKRYNISEERSRELVLMFNESAWIRRLSPLRDAIKYVRKLHEEHGFVFHVISSLSDDEFSQYLRTKNLREIFGDTVFEKYTYLPCGADKDDALSKYLNSGCFYIEDKIKNSEVGLKLGLNALLMTHTYNSFYNGVVPKVKNWKEIYELIVNT